MVKSQIAERDLPPIPPKHYFTIGEVSQLCDIKPHVLRYWEQEFLQLRQVKRRGNRRYYQPREVELIRHIRALLYERGFTITGARHELAQRPARSVTTTEPHDASSMVKVGVSSNISVECPSAVAVNGEIVLPLAQTGTAHGWSDEVRAELEAIVLLLSC